MDDDQDGDFLFSDNDQGSNLLDPNGIFSRMLGVESGGRQFTPLGQTLTSRTGAEGIAQVEPGTGPQAAQYAGVEWDPERLATDPIYNRTLGHAYFNHWLGYYGDSMKAVAAYNAGPGAVDRAVAQWGDSWLGHMPSETQDYVKKVLGSQGQDDHAAEIGPEVASPIGNNASLVMALLQRLAPQHKFTPVDYDPFAVERGGESSV